MVSQVGYSILVEWEKRGTDHTEGRERLQHGGQLRQRGKTEATAARRDGSNCGEGREAAGRGGRDCSKGLVVKLVRGREESAASGGGGEELQRRGRKKLWQGGESREFRVVGGPRH